MALKRLGLLVWTLEICIGLKPVNSRMSSSKNWGDPGAVFGLRPDDTAAGVGSGGSDLGDFCGF